MIVAMSSRVAGRLQPANFATHLDGKRLAARAAQRRSPNPASFVTSSMKMTSPGGCILTFSRKTRALTIVFRSHCCAHEASERLHQRMFVGTLEHDEANRAVNRSDEQRCVRHRHMVRRQ